MSNFFPELAAPGGLIETMRTNKEQWKSYQENDEDKLVYGKMEKNAFMGNVKGCFKHKGFGIKTNADDIWLKKLSIK